MNDLRYEIIFPEDKRFQSICDGVETCVVIPNLSKNGGTLNFEGLTYASDILILCRDKNHVIGFNSLVIDKNQLYVYQIAIKEDYKRKGIGSHMMMLAISVASELDLIVSAHVRDYNTISQRMFLGLGFRKNLKYSETDNFFYTFVPTIERTDPLLNTFDKLKFKRRKRI